MTSLLDYDFYHRDKFKRVIRIGDIVAYASDRQGYGLTVVRITKYTEKQVHGVDLDSGKPRRFTPTFCIVITDQVRVNLEGSVGVNDSTEPVKIDDLVSDAGKPIKTAKQFFAKMGIDVDKEMEKFK